MRPGNRLIAICAAVGLGLASVSAWAGEVRQVLLNTGATGTRAEISLVGSGGYKTLLWPVRTAWWSTSLTPAPYAT